MAIAAITHIIFEICSVFLLMILFYINYKKIKGAYSIIMAMGFLTASVSDIIHIILSIFSTEYWGTFSWTFSRFSLIFCFLTISIIPKKVQSWDSMLLFFIGVLPIILLSIGVVLYSYDIFNLGYHHYEFIHRPIDFILMLLWIGAAIILYRKRIYLFPPYTFIPFMSLGILLHTIMAFASINNLDLGFQIAHVFKLIEYSSLIGIYWIVLKLAKTDKAIL